MTPPAYSVIGRYKRGVWLVVKPDGAAAIVDRQNLPAYTPGTKYFWLGGTPGQASDRLPLAMGNLGLDVSTFPDVTGITPAFSGKIVGLSGDWGAPGGSGPKPFSSPNTQTPTYPGATYAQGPLGISSLITSVEDFLSYIAWLFHPLNFLRAAEFLLGIIVGGYGIWLLTSRSGRGLGRAVTAVPVVGRTIRVAQGTRMGRHEGQREAARMRARQRETLGQRRESAYERERINLDARQSARSG